MIEYKLGNRYAKSIFGLAEEKGTVEAVKTDFQAILAVCKANPDFVNMLRSPIVFADRKQKIFDKLFGGRLSVITEELVRIIIRKGREQYIPDIGECFLSLYDEKNRITRGILTSAHPISDDQRQRILKMVEKELGTTFMLEEKIDSSVIGGFILQVGDKRIDGSLSGRLRKLKMEFDKNPYIQLV